MKTLYLVRHAKSSWKDANPSDFDRPLNGRGICDAPIMGKRLAAGKTRPGLIVSSPAKRAMETALLLAAEINYRAESIVYEEGLYEAGIGDLMGIIQSFPDRVSCIMLVGHNPGITELVNRLAGTAIDNVPTCGLALLRMEINFWSGVNFGKATLLDFDYPKKFNDA